jgi:hypothetical protein
MNLGAKLSSGGVDATDRLKQRCREHAKTGGHEADQRPDDCCHVFDDDAPSIGYRPASV